MFKLNDRIHLNENEIQRIEFVGIAQIDATECSYKPYVLIVLVNGEFHKFFENELEYFVIQKYCNSQSDQMYYQLGLKAYNEYKLVQSGK